MNGRGHMVSTAILLLGLALALGPAAPVARAQEGTAETGQTATGSYGRGFAIFQRYCRSCHGKAAMGDGHVAKYLQVAPTDLTVLTAENGGEFPTERVLRSIDGREEMSSLHGRDMPIWGAVFQADEGQSEADAQQKLADVIAYLEGIQVERAASEATEQED